MVRNLDVGAALDTLRWIALFANVLAAGRHILEIT